MSKRKAEDHPPEVAATDGIPNNVHHPIVHHIDSQPRTESKADDDGRVISTIESSWATTKRLRRGREPREWAFANPVGPASRTRARTAAMIAKAPPLLGSPAISAVPPAFHTESDQPQGREFGASTERALTSPLHNERAPLLAHSKLVHPFADKSGLNNGMASASAASSDQERSSAAEDSDTDSDTDSIFDGANSDTSYGESDVVETPATARSGKAEPVVEIPAVKPEALGQPRVWANTRSALGDSCPYYQARQGSTYHKSGKIFGMLIDGLGTDHDVFLSQVIITSLGGGREQDRETKRLMLSKNRNEDDPAVKRFLTAKASGDPIPIIVGDKNPLCPVKLPHPYCVLDFFHVTDVWPEIEINKGGRMNLWMLRFERVDLDTQEWWAPPKKTGQDHYQPGQYLCARTICRACQRESKQIYDQGWTCLNSKCSEHFKFDTDLGNRQPTYSQAFLCERTAARVVDSGLELIPPLPTHSSLGGVLTFGTESAMKKGVVCRYCGCCSRRISWKGWECENPACNWTYSLNFREYPLNNVLQEAETLKSGNKRLAFKSDWLQTWDFKLDGYAAETFAFPDEDGKIIGIAVVLRATRNICSKSGGPDELFRDLQRDDLHLQRNPARAAGSRIEELTSHFLSNWGALYKFGVTVGTTGFDNAPKPILRSLSQLTWAQERVVQEVAKQIPAKKDIDYCKESMSLRSERFNELLSLGYFESSHISYHDDGEKELGPTVATLSLGSPSIMRFQPKKNNGIGRKADSKKRDKPAVLAFPIYHGDIVIMHGTQIHRLYNHAVQPFGKLRFALTCRSIRIETIQDTAKQQESVEKGKIPEGIESLAYKGAIVADDVDRENANNTTTASELIEEAIAAHTDDSADDSGHGPAHGPSTPMIESHLTMTAAERFQSSWMRCKDHLHAHPDTFTELSPSQRDQLIAELLSMAQQLHASRGMSTP